MAKKNKKLQCFDLQIFNKNLSSSINVFNEIKKILENGETVESRYRQLAEVDKDGEGDFIANYKIINNELLFACFVSMKRGGALEIKKAFFSKKNFALQDLEIKNNIEAFGYIKDYTHFLLTKDFLILKICQGIKVETINTYLNWLLSKEKEFADKPKVFNIKPHLTSNIDLNTISAFVLDNELKLQKAFYIKDIIEKCKVFFNENISPSYDFTSELNDVFDTCITFKIKKLSKLGDTEKKRIIQTVLNDIGDKNLKILNKQNKPIDIDNIKSLKEISITYTTSGFPDEAELETEMRLYLNEVQDEKTN